MDATSQKHLQNLQPKNQAASAEVGRLIAHSASQQWQDFLKGLWLYQHSPVERADSDWQMIAQHDAVALKYLPGIKKQKLAPVLLVPSLINRFHILDLHPQQSFAAFLQAKGHDVYLLDWHHDTRHPLPADIETCLTAHLKPCLDAISKPHVIGYCMGGTLSVLGASRWARQMRSLTLFATPWDFHAPTADASQQFAQTLQALQKSTPSDHITAEWLQMLFWQRDSLAALHKFRSFTQMDATTLRAALFVLAEDWLNDGVDLPTSLIADCAEAWFQDNRLPRQTDLKLLRTLPTQIITAQRDKLVPSESSLSLTQSLPNAIAHTYATGHIGLFAGQKASAEIWPQVQQFLTDHNK